MERELSARIEGVSWPKLNSIYFGGGTPSLLSAQEIFRFLEIIERKFSLEGLEITLEANPDDLSKEKLKELKAAGINRLSIGVQSFFEEDLIWMNRSHNAAQALACIQDAAECGFKELSADLIFGFPLLSDEKWQANMEKMLSFPITHLSTYSMTVETGTALHHAIYKKKERPMEEGQAEKQYRMIMDFLQTKGWEHYEISNFCSPGHPSKHNSAYWSGASYLGIGPSAHGYNGSQRYWNIANNAAYLQGMKDNLPSGESEQLEPNDLQNEYVMTRLRTAKGIDWGNFTHQFGSHAKDSLLERISEETLNTYYQMGEQSLRLNREGFLIADYLISELFEE